jgi:hypothetical protein
VVGQPKPELVRRQLQLAAPSHLAAPAAAACLLFTMQHAAFCSVLQRPQRSAAKRWIVLRALQNAAKRCKTLQAKI